MTGPRDDAPPPRKSPTTADLVASLKAWRRDPQAPLACPACGANRLEIVDKSARPYREWYAFACPGCGLDRTLEIPLAGPPPGS